METSLSSLIACWPIKPILCLLKDYMLFYALSVFLYENLNDGNSIPAPKKKKKKATSVFPKGLMCLEKTNTTGVCSYLVSITHIQVECVSGKC